ncbi:hypothetical protein ACHAQA_005024 [Verticillium albo-atrum]
MEMLEDDHGIGSEDDAEANGTQQQKSQSRLAGDSSLTAHATFANTILERAVSVGPMETPQPEMEDTLANLRTLVDALNRDTTVSEEAFFNVSTGRPLEEYAMPPIEAVMVTLRMVKENPLFEYISFNFFLPSEQFMDYVIKIYFPGGYDLAEFIIVNACLMDYFFRRATFESDDAEKQELQGFAKLCEENLVATLQTLPVYMPNTLNYIMALLLGVFHYMRSSKTCIAWTLTTTALQMCQSAGIHRVQSMKADSAVVRNQKMWTFWMLYSVEKGLSLRLGRPSTVQDYDITIPLPEIDPFHAGPLVYVSLRWIKLSQVQGKIYKGLYSPAGLAESAEVRSRWANALAEEMRVLYATMKGEEQQQKSQWRNILGAQMEMCDLSEEVMFLSTMTIVLRAIPVPSGTASSFTVECIETARKALESHQKYFRQMEGVESRDYDAYLNWTILYTPFAPFIVIFCHIVESCVATDLPRLQAFVQSLEGISSQSESIAGMFRYFSVLYKVASRYTEMKAPQGLPIMDDSYRDFDAYVHALGLIPTSDQGFGDGTGFSGGSQAEADGGQMQGFQLGEWFNTNQQLLGLMEENLF